MKEELQVYGLMAQAEDIQKEAEALLMEAREAQAALRNTPVNVLNAVRGGVKGEVREILKQELKGVSEGLQGLLEGVQNAVGSQVSLAHATERKIRGARWQHTLFLLLVGGLIAGGLWMFQDFALEQAKKERAALTREIAILSEQAEKLKAKTWGVELVEWRDGGRGIILPKGMRVKHTGQVEDGREAIVITQPR